MVFLLGFLAAALPGLGVTAWRATEAWGTARQAERAILATRAVAALQRAQTAFSAQIGQLLAAAQAPPRIWRAPAAPVWPPPRCWPKAPPPPAPPASAQTCRRRRAAPRSPCSAGSRPRRPNRQPGATPRWSATSPPPAAASATASDN
ncbi:hypothetical protein ACFQU2_15290 [Siccirubricoccus deserti]